MTENSLFGYIEYATMTNMGRIRQNNEDAFLAVPEAGCFVVADGMGGGDAGEVASETVVKCLQKAVKSVAEDSPGCRKYAVQQSLHKANADVNAYREAHQFAAMGSTVVLLLLDPWNAGTPLACHVGDSRLYCLRNGELFSVTSDHSVGNEMRRKGLKPPPEKVAKALTRVIGGGSLLVPEWQRIALCPNDLFLLCSDGIMAVLSDDQIERVMNENSSPKEIVYELQERVLAGGAPDNLTAICLRVADNLPVPLEVDPFEREESDHLLKVAEDRKDYGTK